MLLVYYLAFSWTIVDFAPNAAAQDYQTFIHLPLSTSNAQFRLTAITTGDGNTNIFLPYLDSQEIQLAAVTDDFNNYYKSNEKVKHLTNRDVLPYFAVYDPNTSGLANDYIMGILDDGLRKIVAVISDSDFTNQYCYDCFFAELKGYTSTSWDPDRQRWVSLAKPPRGDCFAVSADLKKWKYSYWDLDNPDIDSYEEILEMFPITDQDDPSLTVWVIIRNSKPDDEGLVALLWDVFVPDDNDRQYQVMGVLDASPYINEYALVNENTADYRSRKVVVSQRADYTAYGLNYNTFVTGRELTFKDGLLRQMPVTTVYGQPTFERFFPTIAYGTRDSVLSGLPPSFVFKIEVEMEIVNDGSGFSFFLNPEENDDCAVQFIISGSFQVISLSRYDWFFASASTPQDNYTDIYNPFTTQISGAVNVLILVDVCIVEYFVLDGVYAGSIVAFPDLTWGHHDFKSYENTTITNLKFTTYDALG